MTKRMVLVQAVLALFAVGAQAETMVFHGTLASRQLCKDSGAGIFAKELGCKKMAVSQKACAVAVDISGREINRMQVEVPEAYANGDAVRAMYDTSVSARPYLYQQGFMAYNVKLDRVSSSEVKVASDGSGRVLAVNMYFDHQFAQDGTRTYKQYECRGLKRVK